MLTLPLSGGLQFVSNGFDAPYAWRTFADAGIQATMDVSAIVTRR